MLVDDAGGVPMEVGLRNCVVLLLGNLATVLPLLPFSRITEGMIGSGKEIDVDVVGVEDVALVEVEGGKKFTEGTAGLPRLGVEIEGVGDIVGMRETDEE